MAKSKMRKNFANRDVTYCYGINCKKYEKCRRYVGNYDFKKDVDYSFIAKCSDDKYEIFFK